MAGDAETPLVKKLGIHDGAVVVLVNAPADLRIDTLGAAVFPAGSLWIAWPKRSSGVPSDLTDQVVRTIALAQGLVDNKVCAIDATWSGLRVVWPVAHRHTGPQVGAEHTNR